MKNKHGGKRKGAGRNRLDKDVQKRRNITLCDRLAEKGEKLGGGNLSKGIRLALESL